MTTEKQPSSNDYRKRIARPVFVRTFYAATPGYADHEANDYSEIVTDEGGEVLTITSYTELDSSGDYPKTYHYRVLTYSAPRRIGWNNS